MGCSGVPTELHPVLWQMLKLEWQCKIVCVGARSDFGPLYQPVFRCRQRQHFRQSDSSQHSVGTREVLHSSEHVKDTNLFLHSAE